MMAGKLALLIVEDDANLATNLQHILEVEGYRAAIAENGQSALALSRKLVFALAIIDIKLPDMSGLKLIEKLAELSPPTEYIISTGYASLETALEAVGQRRIVAYETKPLNMDHILSLIRQVTERQQAEEFSRTLLTSSPIGIYIVQDGQLQLVNPRLLKLTGYSQAEALGKDSLSFVLPEDREMVRENAMNMLRGERSSPYEYRLVDKGGRVRWVMETITSIQYQGRQAVLGNYMDITEDKQAEKALEAQKELTDRVLASTPSAVLVVDRDLEIVLANRAFSQTFKVDGGGVEGKPLGDVLPIAGLDEAIGKTLTEKSPQLDLEFRYEVESGEMILLAQITPMAAEEVLLIFRDVTAERAREEQLHRIERLASIGEVAAGVAHELNNPLSAVLGYSELVLGSVIPQEIKSDVEVIHNNAQRAVTIVRNLLTFARRQEPQRRYLSINDLIRHVLEMRGYELKVSNITVIMELADGLPEVMADPQQLEQVFLNIILNAEQAMLEAHNRGTLTIKTKARRGMVSIALSDDGPGIPAANLRRVFDPFFTTKAPDKGTGLGLSICYGIVTEHGGRIYAESVVGQGTIFFVELPVAEAEGVPRENG